MELEEGRISEGVDLWQRAVIVDPQQLPRLLAFASHLWNQGNRAAAGPLIEIFLELAPPETYAKEIARLRQLLESTS